MWAISKEDLPVDGFGFGFGGGVDDDDRSLAKTLVVMYEFWMKGAIF